MSNQRAFGSELGNTTTEKKMTASSTDASLVKSSQQNETTRQMETTENGVLRLPRPLAVEVYSKIHNSTMSRDDLLDEIEDLVDEKYFVGEKLLSAGKEYTVVSSEKRGGLTMYTMDDGTKIGHRDLRRKKGYSVEEIKQIAIDDVTLHEGKVWKVKDELLKECPIRETKKFAPIFSSANRKANSSYSSTTTTTTPTVAKGAESTTDSDSDVEEIKEGDAEKANGSTTPARRSSTRPTGGPATTASRRLLDKKKEKEQKEREKQEKKDREKEEKLKKKEEEKAKKLKEKEEKTAAQREKKNGTMDAFVKKENGGTSDAPLFSPSKWGEKRTALGLKKMDEAWKKRDQEAFNEACLWCEKNLSGVQRNSIENPTFRFAIQKTVDKTKDKLNTKGISRAKKTEYRLEMIEKRKDVYSKFEPIIKAWFREDIALDDLLVTSDPLDLAGSKLVNCDEELLKCMEIAQYFVSMRKILLWNENITAEQLRNDLHNGVEGFKASTYKMIANLLETALQEKEHEKAAHCNARLSEFPITEHTITELVRAFFVGNDKMSYKRDSKRSGGGGGVVKDSEDPEEEDVEEADDVDEAEDPEEMESEDVVVDPEDVPEIDDEEEAQKVRILALFTDPTHIYEWTSGAQLELLCALKEVVHGLPIIREWFLRDANSEQLTGLKGQANKISAKIEQFQQQLQDLPPGEITAVMSRHQTRDMERIIRKRQQLEKDLDDLRDELEENREASARERDDLERIFRVVSIGNDRHLRKYYWFAYSSDAGIWVQDFGTTSYEKWVRECSDKGFMDVESVDVENRPEYEDFPITSAQSKEIWYKLDSETAIQSLLGSLKKNGKREKPLKKYISDNMSDILASISKASDKKKDSEDVDVKEEDSEDVKDSEESPEDVPLEEDVTPAPNRFTGAYASLKLTMIDLLSDWRLSGITKIVDTQQFETKLNEAKTFEEMKTLIVELTASIPESCLIEKFPQNVAIQKKCFSQLKMYRFRYRVAEATNPSCLHLLLAYFDARIDQQKTITEMPCQVCRRKQGLRKLMCKQCSSVFHIQCHRPTISRDLYEEEGYKEGWWCSKCTKDDRRRQLMEAKVQQREQNDDKESNSSGSDSDEEQEEEDVEVEEEEEETMSRGRSAKRKANAAMRGVLEFEGVLRQTPAPPPPKKVKSAVLREVQKLFDSIEKANPRLYKFLQTVPSQSRFTRNSHHETRSLMEIEEDLDVYKSADLLHSHLTQFFQNARGYIESHNPRKLDELDSMISELNFC